MSKECSCVTHERVESGGTRVVNIEERCGSDFASMLDTLCVPRENLALVTVRTRVDANSTTSSWKECGVVEQPNCTQMFFFDMRRSIQDLRVTLATSHMVNHSMKLGVLPIQKRPVVRAHRTRCQCNRIDCVGSSHRRENWHRRLYGKPLPDSDLFAPPNECPITSPCYDEIHKKIYVPGEEALTNEEETKRLVNGLLQHWIVTNRSTGALLLDENYVSPEDCATCANTDDTVIWSKSDTSNTEHGTNCGVKEASRLCTDIVSVHEINVDDVLALRCKSHHMASMCTNYVATEFSGTKLPISDAMARLMAPNSGVSDYVSKTLAIVNEKLESQRCEMLLDDDERARLMELFAAARHEFVPVTDRNDRCACLFEYYLRNRCAKQIDLTITALPANPIYIDIGDSIWHIGSPVMREIWFTNCLERLPKNRLEKFLENDDGSPEFRDALIAASPHVHARFEKIFGPFTVTSTGTNDIRQVSFLTGRVGQRQHQVQRAMARRYTAQKLTSEQMSDATYDQILREACEMFGTTANSLSELALMSGLFGNSTIWRRHAHWMPLAMRNLLLDTTVGYERQLEIYAYEMLETPQNNRMIMAIACERNIVEELGAEPNRRLALARISSSFMRCMNYNGAVRQAAVFCAGTLAILVIYDMVAKDRRRRILAACEKALTACTATPKRKKKKVKRTPVGPKKQNRKAPPVHDDSPEEDSPVEDSPVDDSSADDSPVDDYSVEDSPAEDSPVEDSPEDSPTEDSPEDSPTEDSPEDSPTEDSPEDSPTEDSPEDSSTENSSCETESFVAGALSEPDSPENAIADDCMSDGNSTTEDDSLASDMSSVDEQVAPIETPTGHGYIGDRRFHVNLPPKSRQTHGWTNKHFPVPPRLRAGVKNVKLVNRLTEKSVVAKPFVPSAQRRTKTLCGFLEGLIDFDFLDLSLTADYLAPFASAARLVQ